MLRYFFERTEGNIYRHLFNGKRSNNGKILIVIKVNTLLSTLTLKDCKAEKHLKEHWNG